MPKRTDINSILIIGAGPIIIGQACEFDYSGTQGIKALKELGYRVILVNSNPATIMTDPDLADKTYIEPITPEFVAKIIEAERPDALLPTLGGQTALNTALKLHEQGVLAQYNVHLIGASVEAIKKAEDRLLFRDAMKKIGVPVPRSMIVNSVDEALKAVKYVGFPAILRPAFTLGGTGGNISYTRKEYIEHIKWALHCSPVSQVLVEQSLLGWKEYELEVVRDHKDNVIIVCSIENFDPMGVHTGDSITVAPAQTLTDKEYQRLRDASLAIIREIGVDTGGSNIQFAVNPKNGEYIVIEMNPRVSRSSALASKATGFPIAKVAAKLAVGFSLDELKNDITKTTPASFEPSIDYVVTKVPRFTFEKFPAADDRLGTQMKSVGEVMAIGRTFQESLQKALQSLELKKTGLDPVVLLSKTGRARVIANLRQQLRVPRDGRIFLIADALRLGLTVKQIASDTGIDPWFLVQVAELVTFEDVLMKRVKRSGFKALNADILRSAKRLGFGDERLAKLCGVTPEKISALRKRFKVLPTYAMVDTCAAEFVAHTPYFYSSYETVNESIPKKIKKVVILGSGPNRIGQGIEFDYCCCHASQSLRAAGYQVIMVNCNPETVSTDYDTSDRLYFEPLTAEHVLSILELEKPDGVVVQFGGQTPLKLAEAIHKAGFKILGTSSKSIEQMEDREQFAKFVTRLKLLQPQNGSAHSLDEAVTIARKIGFPVMVRPSFVLGGRAMQVVYDESQLEPFVKLAFEASPEHPVLIDKFLEQAIEVDVDVLCDGKHAVIGGIMEHIQWAGIHSGDSACSLPPYSLKAAVVERIAGMCLAMARELKVVGLMNVQLALSGDDIYVLEVNPRASRTVPFVSKATGVPLAKIAAQLTVGVPLSALLPHEPMRLTYFAIKDVVLPFNKFPGVDTLLGPEMKSTGEVMGIDTNFGRAFAKSQEAAGNCLPTSGAVFVTVHDGDKNALVSVVARLIDLGFTIVATKGTAEHLERHGLKSRVVQKHYEGADNILEPLRTRQVAMVINTHSGRKSAEDSYAIRRTALETNTPCYTTMAAARAAVEGISELCKSSLDVRALQEYASLRINQTDLTSILYSA